MPAEYYVEDYGRDVVTSREPEAKEEPPTVPRTIAQIPKPKTPQPSLDFGTEHRDPQGRLR